VLRGGAGILPNPLTQKTEATGPWGVHL